MSKQMMSLAELLGQRGGDEDEDEDKAPLAEAQVLTLQEVFADYQGVLQGCPFIPGQLVIPKKGLGMRGADMPHIVLEVLDDARTDFTITDSVTTSSAGYGRRIDMRVLCWMSGNYVPFWVESWQFKPYQSGKEGVRD